MLSGDSHLADESSPCWSIEKESELADQVGRLIWAMHEVQSLVR
jgi:hypothetical protein